MRRFLSLAAFLLSTAAFAAPPQTVTLQVQKMTCGTCPIVVRKALQRVPGVSSATFDEGTKTPLTIQPHRLESRPQKKWRA